jgi:hypothetical protein
MRTRKRLPDLKEKSRHSMDRKFFPVPKDYLAKKITWKDNLLIYCYIMIMMPFLADGIHIAERIKIKGLFPL